VKKKPLQGEVVPVQYKATKQDTKRDLVVGVFTTESFVGQILMPAGMLKVGWTVSITQGAQQVSTNDCGEVTQETTSPGLLVIR